MKIEFVLVDIREIDDMCGQELIVPILDEDLIILPRTHGSVEPFLSIDVLREDSSAVPQAGIGCQHSGYNYAFSISSLIAVDFSDFEIVSERGALTEDAPMVLPIQPPIEVVLDYRVHIAYVGAVIH